jgi:hypothetical protein|tara:strand:+ start:755 stop:910 length:156 start_codon:yes stop_codon:yes gene_type:complete
LKIALYLNETFIAELSDDKVEEIFIEYIEENYPEHQPTQADDFIQVIPTDY